MDLFGWIFAVMLVFIFVCAAVYVLAGIFIQALTMVVLMILAIKNVYREAKNRG